MSVIYIKNTRQQINTTKHSLHRRETWHVLGHRQTLPHRDNKVPQLKGFKHSCLVSWQQILPPPAMQTGSADTQIDSQPVKQNTGITVNRPSIGFNHILQKMDYLPFSQLIDYFARAFIITPLSQVTAWLAVECSCRRSMVIISKSGQWATGHDSTM